MASMHSVLDSLTPSWIRTFLAVARHLNYTRAARGLYLSQPAVSRQIKALERGVGCDLFERMGRKLSLTEAGRALLHEAQRIEGDIARASEVLRAVQRADVGRLRIGASSIPGHYLLPRALGRFVARRPEVEVSVRLANTLTVEESLLRNELDIGLVGGHLASRDLHSERIVEDDVILYAHRRHPLAARRRVEPRDLVDSMFIVREAGSATRRAFETWLSERGLSVRKTLEVECPEAAKRYVEAGLGIGVTSRRALAQRKEPLRALRVSGLNIRRDLLVVWHENKTITPLHRAFLETLKSSVTPAAVS